MTSVVEFGGRTVCYEGLASLKLMAVAMNTEVNVLILWLKISNQKFEDEI